MGVYSASAFLIYGMQFSYQGRTAVSEIGQITTLSCAVSVTSFFQSSCKNEVTETAQLSVVI